MKYRLANLCLVISLVATAAACGGSGTNQRAATENANSEAKDSLQGKPREYKLNVSGTIAGRPVAFRSVAHVEYCFEDKTDDRMSLVKTFIDDSGCDYLAMFRKAGEVAAKLSATRAFKSTPPRLVQIEKRYSMSY